MSDLLGKHSYIYIYTTQTVINIKGCYTHCQTRQRPANLCHKAQEFKSEKSVMNASEISLEFCCVHKIGKI